MQARAQVQDDMTEIGGGTSRDTDSHSGQYVTFSSKEKHYGVDVMLVREIRSWTPTTALPEQPHTACGVLDIRGEVVQVYDLSAVLGGGHTEATEGHVVLVVSVEDRSFGILVDTVSDIIHVRKEDHRVSPNGPGVVSAIAKHDEKIVAILDPAKIIRN